MTDREDKIRQRAYGIWEAEGYPHGRHEDHWLRAMSEVGVEPAVASPANGTAAKPALAEPAPKTKAKTRAAAPRKRTVKKS